MPFITFRRNNAFFLSIFTALAMCFTLSSVMFAQSAGKVEFHDLEEQSNNINSLDPLYKLRKTNPQLFKNLSDTSENNLKNISGNIAPSAGELDTAFNPAVDLIAGSVRASAVQADGKLIAAGFFKTVNGSRHANIVRFNADNTIDETFTAATNGTIFAMTFQADGKILIAGVFTTVNGTNRNSLARLNADGTLDTTFNAGNGADSIIYDIAVQADGKIFLGGSFLGVNGYFSPNIVRLNADGSADTTFSSRIPPPFTTSIPSIVYSLALQTDGRVVAGGLIASQFNQTFKSIYRFNPDGTYDTSFDSGSISSNLYKVVIQPDGKFVIGGFFQTINSVSRRYIARLNNDGSLDTTFDPGTNATSPVTAIALKPDGKILFSGITNANGLVKQLNGNGTLDIAYTTNDFSPRVNTLTLTPNGKVFVGSSLIASFNLASNAAFLFNANGSQDTTFSFHPTAEASVSTIAVQPDGKILVGGSFNIINGTSRNGIARLNADGTLDTSFVLCNGCSVISTSSATQINTILLQPDGKILVGGSNIATTSGSTFTSSSLVRLNQDGSIDNTFSFADSLRNNLVNTIALRADGKILVSYFTIGISRQVEGAVSRINADGTLDTTFNFGLTAVIESIAFLPNGQILAGGSFSFGFINSGTGERDFYYGLVRLTEDGALDRTFHAGFVSNDSVFTSVYSVAVQPDGQILAGGRLFTGSSTTPVGVARLNPSGTIDGSFQLNQISSTNETARVEKIKLLANGKILAAGRFNNFGGVPNANVARLNANGLIDPAFQANTDKIVLDIAQQPDGKVLIGGSFESVNNAPRTYFARLLSEPTAPRRAKFDFDGDGKSDISVFRPSNSVWYLNNSTSGFASVNWGLSTDQLTPADFDGDGKTDIAVYRDGVWYLLQTANGFASVQFGSSGDVPQPADFDGDGRAEIAIYRPSSGVWYSLNLANNQVNIVQFGSAEDKPVASDYDGDGKADFAVFRPSNSVWYILNSGGGVSSVSWGIATDKLVPADYDGDGKTDIAVYRDGVWYVLKSTGGNRIVQWGLASDVPAPADFDGDGKADFAIFRDGVWYLLQTANGNSIFQFGLTNDKPVPNSFVK